MPVWSGDGLRGILEHYSLVVAGRCGLRPTLVVQMVLRLRLVINILYTLVLFYRYQLETLLNYEFPSSFLARTR